ncbi:MAG TPA: hypothetical protein VFE33_21840 [Thermoanaerobaculia bacterium]|nr:hypothetical protein [Thermoanaerobaculia bacterium]
MDALISARTGTALLVEGADLISIHAGAPDKGIPRYAEEVPRLFGEALDLQVLRGVDRAQVVRRLQQEADSAEALQLSLILLDPKLSGEIRGEAAEELESALGEEGRIEGLERVLYAHPLPSTADLPGALARAAGHAPRVQNLLLHLTAFQPLIEEVRHAWIDIPDALFASTAERRRFQAALVREGHFRELVLAVRTGSTVESFLAAALLHPVLRTFQSCRSVLQAWVTPFRQRKWQWATEVAEPAAGNREGKARPGGTPKE